MEKSSSCRFAGRLWHWSDGNYYYYAKYPKFIWFNEEFAGNLQLIIYARVHQVFGSSMEQAGSLGRR